MKKWNIIWKKNNVENAVAATTTATRYEKDIDDDADGNTHLSMGHIVKWIYKNFSFSETDECGDVAH